MSSVRVCNKCGWEFPLSYIAQKCKFCKTYFPTQFCRTCKQWKPFEEFYMSKKGILETRCKRCESDRKNEFNKRRPDLHAKNRHNFFKRRAEYAEKLFKKWLELSNKTFKPMTEEEWLQTCAYFGGCAICGDEYIAKREFFVPFQSGGHYTAWNMIPMCENCGRVTRYQENPFKWFDKYGTTGVRMGLTEERRDKIINYLIMQLEKAVGPIEHEIKGL